VSDFIRSTFRWGATGLVVGQVVNPFWPTFVLTIVALVVVHAIADLLEY